MPLAPLHVAMIADDIVKGARGCITCPVARATGRAGLSRGLAPLSMKGLRTKPAYAHVTTLLIFVGRYKAPTPPAVAEFIRRFDAGQAVAPIAFDLELEDA
jgi:hypothetical protein